MAKQQILLYVDGVCRGNGERSAVGGIGVYVGDKHPCNMSEPIISVGRKTSSLAEVVALRRALELADVFRWKWRNVRVMSACQYVVSGYVVWMDSWKRDGWRNSDGYIVAQKGEWEKIYELRTKLQVAGVDLSVHWESKDSSMGGRMADALANAGADISAKAPNCPYCDFHFGVDSSRLPPGVDHDCEPTCCGRSFNSAKAILDHRRDYHSGSYPCPRSSCERVLGSSLGLHNHILGAHHGKGVECNYCTAGFFDSDDRDEHEFSECDYAPICRECDRWFSSDRALEQHEQDVHYYY